MKLKLFVVLLFVAGMISCTNKTKKENFVRSVKVITLKSQPDRIMKTYSGIVKESVEIDLGFSTAGKIERILVKEGEFVRQGEVLARLESKDYALGVEALQIQYDQLYDEVARMKSLYEKKSLSGNDYEKAVAGLKQLNVQLQTSKNKLEYTCLKSPVDGYIRIVNYEESEMVNAGTPVFTIMEDGNKQVNFDIPSSLYTKKDSIIGIYCTGNVNGEKQSELKIRCVSPKADNNQMFKVTADIISGSAQSYVPGMNVNVIVQINDNSNIGGYLLPIQTVFEESGQNFVWTVDDNGIVNRKAVIVDGLSEGGLYIVHGSFRPDDRIVAAGVNSLADGESVNIIDSVSETNVGGLL